MLSCLLDDCCAFEAELVVSGVAIDEKLRCPLRSAPLVVAFDCWWWLVVVVVVEAAAAAAAAAAHKWPPCELPVPLMLIEILMPLEVAASRAAEAPPACTTAAAAVLEPPRRTSCCISKPRPSEWWLARAYGWWPEATAATAALATGLLAFEW